VGEIDFRYDFRMASMQCKLFFTKQGYRGLAPLAVKKRDCVCVLLGASCPTIIRRQDDHYLILGDVYIYGMMYGEVMQDV